MLRRHRAAHELKRIDREMRIHFKGQPVRGHEAIEFKHFVIALRWCFGIADQRSLIVGSLEQAAEQDRNIDCLGTSSRADFGEDLVCEIAVWATEIEKEFKTFSHQNISGLFISCDIKMSLPRDANPSRESRRCDAACAGRRRLPQSRQETTPCRWPSPLQSRGAGCG